MRNRLLLGLILIAALPLNSMFAQTSENITSRDSLEYKWERFSINLGFFLTTIYSDISLAGTQVGLGVNLNLEDALGLSSSTFVIRSEAAYNFGSRKRSHVRLGYFGLIRNSNKTLESEIEIGNTVFPVGTELSSRYDLNIIRTLYDYAYFQDERISLALSTGLYVLPVHFSIGTTYVINENAKFTAPLPVLGIRNIFFITPKILLKQNLEILYLSTSNFEGRISDLNIYVEYNPHKRLGLGLGYNSFNFYINAQAEIKDIFNFQGSIETGFSGFLLYGKYYF